MNFQRLGLLLLLVFCATQTSFARLEYDSEKNKVELYGPYIKFNLLEPPYSFGRFQFDLSDIGLEVTLESPDFSEKKDGDNSNVGDDEEDFESAEKSAEKASSGEDFTPVTDGQGNSNSATDSDSQTSKSQPQGSADSKQAEGGTDPSKQQPQTEPKQEERQPQSTGNLKIYAKWPRFLLSFGRLRLINEKKRVLVKFRFTEKMTGEDEKFARVLLEGEDQDLLKALDEPFQLCVDQKFESSYVKACSDFLVYSDGKMQKSFTGKNAASANLNGRNVPKNSQVSLDANMKTLNLRLFFKSGFSILISDEVRIITSQNLAIDPVEKRIGLISGDGSIRPSQLTIKDRFFGFIKENNYFKQQYYGSKDWPQNLDHAEMEFAPYQKGASAQLYGLILPNVPPPFDFEMNPNNPIATYNPQVELKGTKRPDEVLAAAEKNQLFIHNNQTEFIWRFPAPNKADVNQHYLSYQSKGKDYFFSKRVFRAHKTAFSGSLASSTSPTLDIVPGYNFAFEHWFEEVWNKSKYSYQRWGVAANIYETLDGFEPKKNFGEKISVLPINADIMFRFTPGVRPVQSSFGVGLRYLQFKLFRSIYDDVETRLVGIGGFWHSAPQKIVDDIFNIVPFFRYPKWVEASFYYYPLLLGPERLGFSFSWQVRGRMMFAKNWFLEASFNVNTVQFSREKLSGVTLGADDFGIGTAHGTVGVGYFFN